MTTTNQYDKLNRLSRISSVPSASSAVTFDYGYNPANQRIAVTNADGSYWLWAYDDLGQVVSARKYWAGGTPVLGQQFDFAFDDIGNRKVAVTGGDQWGANKRYQNYSANLLNQYEQRTVPSYLDVLGAATNSATVTVNNLPSSRQSEYFRAEVAFNNSTGALWLSLTNLAVLLQGTNTDIVATNIGNAFISGSPEQFRYDVDGNLTNDGRWAYVWDAENRLVRMLSLTATPSNSWRALNFAYDPQSRRISKVVSNWNGAAWTLVLSNKFLYDGWNLIAEVNGTNNTVIRSYAWGTDLSGTTQGAGGVGGLLMAKDSSGGTYFVAYDGNGNVAALVNATNGTVSAQYEYGPFGELLRATGPMAKANPFRLSTKYQDDETDLVYYGYRYEKDGRWLSRDPSEEESGLNLYPFLGNDGINAFDFLGLATRTFPLYRLPYLKKPVLAYADVNVWRSSQGPILIKVRVWRKSDEQSRRTWNSSTAWPGMPQTWDAPHQWLWPNMASLLNARGSQRYGEPDPSRDNMDAAFFGAVAMPEGGTRSPLVSADWLNDNGVVDKQAISHSAFLNPGFAISVSSQCPDPPPIGFWLVFPDGNRGGDPGGGWPREWDGTVYLYTKITWSGGGGTVQCPRWPTAGVADGEPLGNLEEQRRDTTFHLLIRTRLCYGI
jgi:RHS repeat-associated protein